MKKLLIGILVVAALVAVASPLMAGRDGNGNGAPSGPHYNLNIIGVPRDKTASMDNNNGHRIFVDLGTKDGAVARTKILLCESGVDEGCEDVEDFKVLDANGTDGEASFALPNPDPENDGITVYSVWARTLGKPGGSASMNTCAYDPIAEEEVCSLAILELERDKGRSRFDDVSKYLLYMYVDLDDDGKSDRRVPLFHEDFEDYLWYYDNNGLKMVQLRFYEIPSEDIPKSW